MKKIALVSSALLLIWACSPKTTSGIEPIESTEKTETASAADMEAGKALYDGSCARCHDLPEISNYSKEKWEKILPPMSKKAKLDVDQEKLVSAYVMGTLNN